MAVCISHSANTLDKGINITILPPAMGKIVGQTGLFNLDRMKTEFTAVKFCLKIDFVVHPACAESGGGVNLHLHIYMKESQLIRILLVNTYNLH